MSSSLTTIDRARGVLLGLAVGDALGGPLEFMSPEQIVRTHGGPVDRHVGGGWLGLRPGEGTDDTALALALARSLATGRGYDPGRALSAYLDWYRSDPKDIGVTTRAALDGVAAGRTPGEVTEEFHQEHGRSAGNGTVMRVAPIALRHLREPARRSEAARVDSKLTHFDDHAADVCVLVSDVLAALLDGVDPLELTAPRGLVHEWAPGREVAAELARSDRAGYVGVALAVASTALLSASSFAEGLVWVISLGGDADTNGAVAGALLGARFGETGIPPEWLEGLLVADEARGLADRLLELAQRLTGWERSGENPRRRRSSLRDGGAALEAALAPFRGRLEHDPESRIAAELLIARSGVFREGPMLVSHVPARDALYVHERAFVFDDLEPARCVEVCDQVRLMLDLSADRCVGFVMNGLSCFAFEAPENAVVWGRPRFDVPALGIEQGTVGLIAATARLLLAGLRTPDRVWFDQALAAGESEEAIELWQACLDEGNELARYALGYTLLNHGRALEAKEQLKHYSSLVRWNAWAWCYVGQACEALEDWEEAEYAYRQALTATRAGANDTDAPERLAELLRRRRAG